MELSVDYSELAKRNAWIEGEAEAKDLIFKIAEEVTNAQIPVFDIETNTETIVPSRWEEIYSSNEYLWVTYKANTRPNAPGVYKHTDGQEYPVYRLPNFSSLTLRSGAPAVDELEYFNEIEEGNRGPSSSWGDKGWYGNVKTNRRVRVGQLTYTNREGETAFKSYDGLLVVLIDDPTEQYGKSAYAVNQIMTLADGSIIDSNEWSEFEIIAKLQGDWAYFIDKMINDPKGICYQWEQQYHIPNYNPSYWGSVSEGHVKATRYTFNERHYTANPVHHVNPQVVLKATPDVPDGIPSRDYYVLLEQPVDDFNYFDIIQGVGVTYTEAEGDPRSTYEGACDPLTVRAGQVPTIISQQHAHAIYLQWEADSDKLFKPPAVKFEIDYDGVTEIKSPPAHCFHGRDSTVPWLTNKKRRPDYLVTYHMAVNNDRIAMVLEGDPSPGIHDYYRNFVYIGKIVPFNQYDHMGNFGVTCGMGDLEVEKTGYTLDDINEETNPIYAGYGEYTSNGMYSMSMYRTRSNVMFQAYYPAFITQLPNYPSVGTIPSELHKLIIDEDGFQKSAWTGKYHASPVYMVHQTEGYRGYLDGVVAIHDHNLVNLDELLVDTEVPKDPNDPSKGTWTEVYKFFSIKTPVNLFKYSASPDTVTVAILKETV